MGGRGQRMSARPARGPAQRSCSEFLYWIKAARLRRAARAGGQGPPPLHVSATAPAAPTRSARSIAKAYSQTRKQPRPRRAPGPGRHRPSATTSPNRPPLHATWPTEPQSDPSGQDTSATPRLDRGAARDDGRSVAEAGTGLLETHVTGARSAHAPSWLTFGGSGQNLSHSTTRSRVAAAPASEHANCPGTIGTGVLIRDSVTGPPGMLSRLRGGPVFVLSAAAVRAAPMNRRFGISSWPCLPRRWWADPRERG